MKIGFDAKRLFLNHSGLGNYSRTLVSSLRQEFNEDEFFLYTPRAPKNERTNNFFDHAFNVVTPQTSSKLLQAWWRSMQLDQHLSDDKIEVFHGLSHELPSNIENTNVKSVVTMHDLIFLKFPELYPRIDRMVYWKKVKHALKIADEIVAISERTANDLNELLSIDRSRIKIIYQGCAEEFRGSISPAQIAEVKIKYKLDKPYIICIGTIEERKNQKTLFQSFTNSSIHKDFNLLFIGKQTKYARTIRRNQTSKSGSDQVIWLENISFADLPALLQGATVSVYPSRYEGFGLPVLESLASGVPTIAAKGSCLEEVGGDSAIYFDPDDQEALTEALLEVLNDEELQTKMGASGRSRASEFSNVKMAQEYHMLYENLIGR